MIRLVLRLESGISEDDASLGAELAGQVGAVFSVISVQKQAVASVSLVEETAERLKLVLDCVSSIDDHISMSSLRSSIARVCAKLIKSDRTYIVLLSPSAKDLLLHRGPAPPYKVHVASEGHFLAHVIKAKQTLIANFCDSASEYAESIKEFDTAMNTTTSRLICMPLTRELGDSEKTSTCVGAIICTNKNTDFNADDVALLKLMNPNFTSFIKRALDCEPLLILAKKAVEESSTSDRVKEQLLEQQTQHAVGVSQLLGLFSDDAGPIAVGHPVLARVEAHLAKTFDAQRCEIFLLDAPTRRRLVRASFATGKDAPVLIEADMAKGMIGSCFGESKQLRTSNLGHNPLADADADARVFGGDDYSALVVPFADPTGKKIGVGVLVNKRVDFEALSQLGEANEFGFLDQLCFAAALEVVARAISYTDNVETLRGTIADLSTTAALMKTLSVKIPPLLKPMDTETLVCALMAVALEIIPAQFAIFCKPDSQAAQVALLCFSSDFDHTQTAARVHPSKAGMYDYTESTLVESTIRDVNADHRFERGLDVHFRKHTQTCLACPVTWNKACVGVLHIMNKTVLDANKTNAAQRPQNGSVAAASTAAGGRRGSGSAASASAAAGGRRGSGSAAAAQLQVGAAACTAQPPKCDVTRNVRQSGSLFSRRAAPAAVASCRSDRHHVLRCET